MTKQKFAKGFSLMEILVVLAIMGILASIILTRINAARNEARAAKLIADLKQVEKALSAWGIDQKITRWWHEDTWEAPTDEPRISWLIENTGLGTWLSGHPGIDANLYVYDNDDDTFDANGDGCADSMPWRGVHLNIWDQNLLNIIDIVDKKVDSGDGASCGRIIWDSGGAGGYFIGYRLGNNYDDLPF